jgi:L-seryl-tRNA(Ser) seleniumtransferase
MNASGKEALKSIPGVDALLQELSVRELLTDHPRAVVVDAVRSVLERLRESVVAGREGVPAREDLAHEVSLEVARAGLRGLRRVVNGTGVILHTGLGRAPLPQAAKEALLDVAGYCNVQSSLETGERTTREAFIADLLTRLTGAEAATVVNNNAAATLVVLKTLAEGKEVIVSRGQMVEIGGSFRIPDVMAQSGATLVGVGTTNRTHLRDYEQAITENTGLLLRVHASNYKILGFTKEVSLPELVTLGRKHGLPVMDDLGSGALVDLRRFGVEYEPLVADSVKEGADIATFSADKLIGGPQGGIIVGRKELVTRVRKNPLFRAMRICKLTLASLEATLRLYLDEEALLREIPFYRILSTPVSEVKARAEALAERIGREAPGLDVSVQEDVARPGSGALPIEEVASYSVAVTPTEAGAHEMARRLRTRPVPVFTKIREDRVLVDVRTVFPEDDDDVVSALAELGGIRGVS